jgi:hypothetical protein
VRQAECEPLVGPNPLSGGIITEEEIRAGPSILGRTAGCDGLDLSSDDLPGEFPTGSGAYTERSPLVHLGRAAVLTCRAADLRRAERRWVGPTVHCPYWTASVCSRRTPLISAGDTFWLDPPLRPSIRPAPARRVRSALGAGELVLAGRCRRVFVTGQLLRVDPRAGPGATVDAGPPVLQCTPGRPCVLSSRRQPCHRSRRSWARRRATVGLDVLLGSPPSWAVGSATAQLSCSGRSAAA